MIKSLWGEDFDVDAKAETKKVLNKLKKKKKKEVVLDEKALSKKNVPIEDKLRIIGENVDRILGVYKENTLVIKTREELSEYIDHAIKNGIIAIDTETNNSLDPLTCVLMGACVYTVGQKNAYIPINHKALNGNRLYWQLTEKDIYEEFSRLNGKVEIVTHNGKFDYEVIKCTCGIEVPPKWDTIIGCHLLNEVESRSLKWQYVNKIDKAQEKYSIDELFEDVFYADVDPEIFALYAATDSMMTYKLFEYQKSEFSKSENRKLFRLFNEIEMPIVVVTAEIELAGVNVDRKFGERLKTKYQKELSDVDSKIEEEIKKIEPLIATWREQKEAKEPVILYAPEKTDRNPDEIEKEYPDLDENIWRRYKKGKSKSASLEDPINLSSPTQLAIFFYDIFNLPPFSKSSPRGTGTPELTFLSKELGEMIEEDESADIDGFDDLDEEDLESLMEIDSAIADTTGVSLFEKLEPSWRDSITTDDLKAVKKICDLLIERRRLVKLISSYLDTIPQLSTMWPDGRIRFHLNSLGTKTGRYSSGGKVSLNDGGDIVTVSGINSQNIPSELHQIRMQFKTKPGYSFVGGDFSQQEPLVTAFLSQDPNMLEAFNTGKDIYSSIAQLINNNQYEDNLEYFPSGTEIEIDGKKIITGEKTHINKEGKERRKQAKVIILAAMYGMGGYSVGVKLKKNTKDGQDLLETFFKKYAGVKRAIDNSNKSCRDCGYTEDIFGRRRRLPNIQLLPYSAYYRTKPYINENNPDEVILSYINRLIKKGENPSNKEEIAFIIEEAKKNNIVIRSNLKLIKKAERQCFNARIQGSAASITKRAMIYIHQDSVMKKLGAKMVIQVHDEVILECPTENAEKVKTRLTEIMMNCGYFFNINIPMKCDVVIEKRWGEEAMATDILDEYKDKTQKRGLDHDAAINEISKSFPEFDREVIEKLIDGTTAVLDFE